MSASFIHAPIAGPTIAIRLAIRLEPPDAEGQRFVSLGGTGALVDQRLKLTINAPGLPTAGVVGRETKDSDQYECDVLAWLELRPAGA